MSGLFALNNFMDITETIEPDGPAPNSISAHKGVSAG